MMNRFIDSDGFIDVPAVITAEVVEDVFPGYNSHVMSIRGTDFTRLNLEHAVYLDSTATSQPPESVIWKACSYRSSKPRGSNHSTNSHEARRIHNDVLHAKEKLTRFFCASDYDLAMTSGTTASSNLVGSRFNFTPKTLLLLTEMEHNSQLCTARNTARAAGSTVDYVPVGSNGRLDLGYLANAVSEWEGDSILLNVVHVSNLTGVRNPISEIMQLIDDRTRVYLDMAQSAGHLPIDLNALGVDFAGASAHKMYGPEGVGCLFVNKRSHPHLNDRITGGGGVFLVDKNDLVPSLPPERYEPGTQNLEGFVEWGFTIDYLNDLGMDVLDQHDMALTQYFIGELMKIKGVTIYGQATMEDRAGVVSFSVGNVHTHDEVARRLGDRGISVRNGCFCAHIYGSKLAGIYDEHEEIIRLINAGQVRQEEVSLPGAVRASFAFYNTIEDAYKAVRAIREIATDIVGEE